MKTVKGSLQGSVQGFRLAGIEPDGDPLYQVLLQTRLSPAGGTPPVNLIVDAYLENFQPDTTPILPDLLYPNRTAQNLGGFLQGKILLTDDAGQTLYIGDFLAEAFLDSSHHSVMRLDGSGAAAGGSVSLKGIFTVHRDGSLRGHLSGHIALPPPARRQILRHRGARMRPLQQIISAVTVRPAPMKGRATKGSTGVPLRTGYPTPQPTAVAASPSTTGATRQVSTLTIVAAVGAALAFLLAGVLFWSERKRSEH